MEHDLVVLELGVDRLLAGHVLAGVQPPAVLVPPLQPDPPTEQLEEPLKEKRRLMKLSQRSKYRKKVKKTVKNYQ